MKKPTTIQKKITKEGIEVLLFDNTVIKRYSRSFTTMTVCNSRKEAMKEFSKFRQGYKII